ncbi:MAG: LPS export ABC transporter permease LptF [Alphaproteobacteria bacterium]|nr:LPS export ABC transporter permease LptF [Alphaproteobacteria bacterium]
MKIFISYIFKNLVTATVFIAITLTFIVFLTQSLRFLEIVVNAGNAGSAFWVLTFLALPRFFEVIFPLSIMIATVFIYNKMTIDSELTVMKAVGHSPFSLAKPIILLSLITVFILWAVTLWVAPTALKKMQAMRHSLTSEFSSMLFREGIFNQPGSGLTVYISDRSPDGTLSGLMIHDTRDETKPPSTVLAKSGMMITENDENKVIVFDGSRQSFDQKSGILQILTFERYTINLPEAGPVRKRWAEPDERTIFELLNPDMAIDRDRENLRNFSVEIHRRFTAPLLALVFPLIALTALLIGSIDRRGQTKRIILATICIMLVQGLFLASYNIARNSSIGLVLMYLLTVAPIIICLFFLSEKSEHLRYKFLYRAKNIFERPSP